MRRHVTAVPESPPTLQPVQRPHRARWAAIGAALAVTIGGGSVLTTSASIDSGERGVYVPIAPCRLFDTRPAPDNVGPRNTPLGPGDTFVATVRGTNGNCTIPTDAVGLTMNVAIVNPSTSSFLTVFPADVTRPLAANANWVGGQPPLSNAVTADISADGKIAFYNLAGNVDVAADIVGYYVDHTHDDRYYTKAQSDANNYTKAQSDANYYSKAQSDANDRRGGTRVAFDTDGDFSAIAIGTDGNPVIAYRESNTLKIAKCSNSSCSGAVTVSNVESGNSGLYNSIAIGADGNPVVSYSDFVGNLKVVKCTNPACTARTITPLDGGSVVSQDTSIRIGADGNPIIAYYDSAGDDLKTAKCLNPACTGAPNRNIIDSAGDVGIYASIAIRADGNPVIAYHGQGGGGVLKVAACSNPACDNSPPSTITTFVSSGTDLGERISIAIGVDGNPIIGHYDNTADNLLVTSCGDPSCTAGGAVTSTVDAIGDAGFNLSIRIGIDGLPVIAYTDNTNVDLKFAACANARCTGFSSKTIVDAVGNVGFAPSLAIGVDGLPIISYREAGPNFLLHVAKCSTTTCAT